MGISSTLSKLIKGSEKAVKSAKGKTRGLVDDAVDAIKSSGHTMDSVEQTAKRAYSNARKMKKEAVNSFTATNIDNPTLRKMARGAVAAEDMVEGVGAYAAEKLYKGGKKVLGSSFNIVKDDNTFIGYKAETTKLGTGLLIAGLLGTGAYSATKMHARAMYGDIEGGLPEKSVNATFTPANNIIEAYQSGAISDDRFSNQVMRRNVTSRLAGVNPDIVFALHELRNSNQLIQNEVVK